jgi:hypothetical protein
MVLLHSCQYDCHRGCWVLGVHLQGWVKMQQSTQGIIDFQR